MSNVMPASGCKALSFRCFCKQKTAYEMRISDWSSDVCSSDLTGVRPRLPLEPRGKDVEVARQCRRSDGARRAVRRRCAALLSAPRSQLRAGWKLFGRGDRTHRERRDRKSAVSGKSVSVRVDFGGGRIIQNKNIDHYIRNI